ncbi:MAG TPA: hypothetical protein DIW30_04420, partial [Bacteroidales bacterium]|nr:hypothetical protein [Bacteroidales bacterium]
MSLRKYIGILGCCFVLTIVANAKEKAVPTVMHSWRLVDGFITDSASVDTSYINYPMHDAVN